MAGAEGGAVLPGLGPVLVGDGGGAEIVVSVCIRVKAQEVGKDEVGFVQQTPLVVSSVALCFGYELEEIWLDNTHNLKPSKNEKQRMFDITASVG